MGLNYFDNALDLCTQNSKEKLSYAFLSFIGTADTPKWTLKRNINFNSVNDITLLRITR